MDSDGRQLHRAESGPSNLNAYNEATVRASLSEVIEACIKVSGSKPSATCFGLAGSSSPVIQEQLESIIGSLGLERMQIVTDADIALEGAFSGGPGILLIAGTGSICLGKSTDDTIHRCGGWGWLADDAGSAGWIGQRALEAALQQNDGRMEGHALRNEVFAALSIKSDEEISSKIYRPTLSRSELAELSKCVLNLAHEDAAAASISESAISELAKLVRTTSTRTSDGNRIIAFSGGLLEHNPVFRNRLASRLSDFDICDPATTALEGAVAIARRIG